MLSLGSSKPWPDAIEILTDQRKMDANALLEYFKPLQDWLEKKNKENNVHIGWESDFSKFYDLIDLEISFEMNISFLLTECTKSKSDL